MDFKTWAEQREKCLACKHCSRQDDSRQDHPGSILRCLATPIRGRGKHAYCIDSRDGGPCGVSARLFEAAEIHSASIRGGK